jgi:hypothetical protein
MVCLSITAKPALIETERLFRVAERQLRHFDEPLEVADDSGCWSFPQ